MELEVNVYNQILGSIQRPSIHAGKTKSFSTGFAYWELSFLFLSLYRLSGFYILSTDCFCLPLRNAIPANTSSLGVYSAHGNRVLGEPAHGECKTVLITKSSWGIVLSSPL